MNMREQGSRQSTRFVLAIEDDPGVLDALGRVIARYSELVQMIEARDAGTAYEQLLASEPSVHAVILDLMIPYGSAADLLDAATDPQQLATGKRLLSWLRRQEQEQGRPPLWVAVSTARANRAFLAEVEALVGSAGIVLVKPYDIDVLEDKLMDAMGLPSEVPPELLEAEPEND